MGISQHKGINMLGERLDSLQVTNDLYLPATNTEASINPIVKSNNYNQ